MELYAPNINFISDIVLVALSLTPMAQIICPSPRGKYSHTEISLTFLTEMVVIPSERALS